LRTKEAFVEITRGDRVESRHRVAAAVVDAIGELVAWVGDPELPTFLRSAAKPLQAIPLVADGAADAYQFSAAELAVVCASHSGEPAHVEAVRGILDRIGCSEDDLECGAHWPFHKPAADMLRRDGESPTRIHNNCSGKHAGMLAWSCHHGVDTKEYTRASHPVQGRICREIGYWMGERCEALPVGVDGCGVPSFAQPLNAMAGAYARIVSAAERDPSGAAGRVTRAMTEQPWYVGGTGRLTTRLMETTGGRLLAKFGAEAVYCIGDRDRRWGIALKVEDGHRRAVGPAVIEFLARLDLLSPGELRELDDRRTAPVVSTLGEIVGEIRPAFRVENRLGLR
jgi:L-asparaginase II